MNYLQSKDYAWNTIHQVNYNDAKVRNTGAIDLVGDCNQEADK